MASGTALPIEFSLANFASISLATKRAAAISYLGAQWVLHPQYQTTTRHHLHHRVAVEVTPRTQPIL